jgi:hypothetical protein
MLALAFLKAVQRQWKKKNVLATVPEIRRLLEVVLPRIAWNPQDVIAWFMKQRQNKEKSQQSHTKNGGKISQVIHHNRRCRGNN